MILDIEVVTAVFREKDIQKLITINRMISGFTEEHHSGFYFAGESHDFWEVVLAAEGEITATGDERVHRLSRGMLIFHKPMEFHRLWCEENQGSQVKIISFGAVGEGMKYFENRCFTLNENEIEQFSEITESFERASRCYVEEDYEGYAQTSALAAALLETFLLRLTQKNEYKRKSFSASERQYYQIVKIMKENCEKNLSVGQIAELCNMSVSNMKRIFSLYSDIGLAKFFLNLKLRRARELLEEGFSPTDTAAMLGFNETSYFYTVFKRETGMTPAQFRGAH